MKLRIARKVLSREPDAMPWLAGCLYPEFVGSLLYRQTTMRAAGARWLRRRALGKRLRHPKPYFQIGRVMRGMMKVSHDRSLGW